MREVLHKFTLSGNAVSGSKIAEAKLNYDELKSIAEYKLSLTDPRTGFTAEERVDLLEFLCVKPLSEEEYRNAVLRKYHWLKDNDQIDTTSFYTALLKNAGLTENIFYVKGINYDMLQAFGCDLFNPENYVANIVKCSFTPTRAILQQKIPDLQAKLNDDMEVEIYFKNENKEEPLIQCLFRHIRNSIAHDNTFVCGEDFLFVDFAPKMACVSAVIFMKKTALLDWIKLLKYGKTKSGFILSQRNNNQLYLSAVPEHPCLIELPANVLVNTNSIVVKKKSHDNDTVVWEETEDLHIGINPDLSISGNTFEDFQAAELFICSYDSSQVSGEYKICVPVKFSLINSNEKIDDILTFYFNA